MSLSWNIPGSSTPCPLVDLPKYRLKRTVVWPVARDDGGEPDGLAAWSEQPVTVEDIEAMSHEADETRWWLARERLWQDSQQTISVSTDHEGNDIHILYPLTGSVGHPVSRRKARYCLKFDATIWMKTPQGYILFDSGVCKHPLVEVREITRRLRQLRGA